MTFPFGFVIESADQEEMPESGIRNRESRWRREPFISLIPSAM